MRAITTPCGILALCALTALALAGAAGAASADGAAGGLEGLAPPGPCAQERETLRSDPELEPPRFDLAGAPRDHFGPGDVGAGGRGPGFTPPQAPAISRGPCEGPAAGCADVVAPRGSGTIVTEPPPGGGDGPVFGNDTGGLP